MGNVTKCACGSDNFFVNEITSHYFHIVDGVGEVYDEVGDGIENIAECAECGKKLDNEVNINFN